MARFRLVLISVVAAFPLASPTAAQSPPPPLDLIAITAPGQTGNTFAGGLNNTGQIVGFFVTAARTPYHGLLYDHGSSTVLDVSGARSTMPHGINNFGELVGGYEDSGSNTHGFLWSDGVVTTLDAPYASCGGDPPGLACTEAFGVNDRRQVAGRYSAGGTFHAFLFSEGTFTTIDPPNAMRAEAFGVNNAGQVVGNYNTTDTSLWNQHGFVYDRGRFTIFDVPFAHDYMFVYGISDHGDIVGGYVDNHGGHGFLLRRGLFYTIDVPYPQNGQWALGINASDQIVGQFYDGYGGHIYLATPPAAEFTLMNDAVTFTPVRDSYAITDTCPRGAGYPPGPLFTFTARLTARDIAAPFDTAFIQIASLTADRLVVGAGGEGSRMAVLRRGQYADGPLGPGDSIDVPFSVCLPNRDPFTLTFDVLGRVP